MADRYIKTDSGRAEIQARVHAISRTARNLLLILDASRDGSEWVSMVRGATAGDLTMLFDAGLIALVPDSTSPAQPPASAASAGLAVVDEPAAPGVSPLTYAELYDLLPSLAKEHLGLMKGYRYALAIEKADGVDGLQKVAREMVLEIERMKGTAVARSVKRALLL
jgi:hypothetical protein